MLGPLCKGMRSRGFGGEELVEEWPVQTQPESVEVESWAGVLRLASGGCVEAVMSVGRETLVDYEQ